MYELVHCFGYEQQKITCRFRGRGHACGNVSWFLCNFGPTKEDLKLEILISASWMLEWLGQDPVWAPNGFDKLHPQLTRGGQLELLQARGMVG